MPKKQSIAERKLDLLTKCTEAIATRRADDQVLENPKVSSFSLYVEEELKNLDKRRRIIAEKHITDVIFGMEMSNYIDFYPTSCTTTPRNSNNTAQNFQTQYYNLGSTSGSYLSMLQN